MKNKKLASKWKISLGQNKKIKGDEKVPSILQVVKYLNSQYEVRRNEVLMRTELRYCFNNRAGNWFEITEHEFDTLLVQLKSDGLEIAENTLKSLFNSKYIKSYNPFIDYFTSLPEWDGLDYIRQLADSVITEENQIWEKYLKKWLVGMVRCVTDDTITNQQMLVFQGRQGIGKTRWISQLLPPVLKQYFYTGNANMQDQVFLLKLSRNMLIFLDELDSYNVSKQALIKSIITQQDIKLRPLYQTFDVEVKRRASFIAAINKSGFLNDLTGNRRFLVVTCLSINHTHTINMDKVFSQVFHLAKDKKFQHYFDKEEIIEIEKMNEKYRIKSDLEILIENYIVPCSVKDGGIVDTATEIIEKLKKIPDFNLKVNPHTVGEIMTKLGFERVSKNSGKEKRWGYSLKLKKLDSSTQITHN